MSLRVHRIIDGPSDFLVRGTTDPKVALAAILDEEPEAGDPHVDEGYDVEPVLDVERVGWFRMNPTTGPDYGWLLGFAQGPGRGNFQGIWGSVKFQPVEYEIDYKELDG